MSSADLLSLSRRLIVGLTGPWPTAREERWLARWRPGGVILFSRNVAGAEQLTALCAHLHELIPNSEIVADHEGGPVSQLAAAVGRPPAAWTLGTLADPDLTHRVHAETGRRCRALGIDRILAPCCDVLTEIHNPVIGSRAFGAVAESVALQATAAVTGLAEAQMESCLKHWPGHGGSRVDSHLDVSRIGNGAHDRPFFAGLGAGSAAVMVGHIYGNLVEAGLATQEVERDLPATLDQRLLRSDRTSLRSHSDREVVFYADDVTMGALRVGMNALGVCPADADQTGLLDPGEVSVAWLQALVDAGCDRLLIRGIPWGALPESENPSLEGEPAGEFAPRYPKGRPQADCREDTDIYAVVRQRARIAADLNGFASRDSDLVWLDFTTGDRWEVAAGDGPDKERRLAGRLQSDFRTVLRVDGRILEASEDRWSEQRLLVTSHRPLTDDFVGRTDLAEQLAARVGESGRCLVMGHPSLAGDVGSWLGSGWTISALYDTTVEDYSG
jgi:Glycosyl hydrolase family 3 N terminal domain